MRKLVIPLQTAVLLYKSGVKGVLISRTCFPNEECSGSELKGHGLEPYLTGLCPSAKHTFPTWYWLAFS